MSASKNYCREPSSTVLNQDHLPLIFAPDKRVGPNTVKIINRDDFYPTIPEEVNRNLDQWRGKNASLLNDGDRQRHQAERLVGDSNRLCKDRYEVNRLSETQVKQKLEHRVDDIGYWEDELSGMLHDIKVEDEKLLLCRDRLTESMEKNVKPIWELARNCLQLRITRPPLECTDDEVNFLLREELKMSEKTAKVFDDYIEKLNVQHRANNAISHRCKTLKLLDWETRKALKICENLSKINGKHQKKDLLVQMEPVKMNFARWSALCEDAIRTGLKDNSKSKALRLSADDGLSASNDAIEKIYKQVNEALTRRINNIKYAKENIMAEHRKVQIKLQEVRTAKTDLDYLYEVGILPERTAQYKLTEQILATPLDMANDAVHVVLKKDIHEHNLTHEQCGQKIKNCIEQMVTLRAVAGQLMADSKRKQEALDVDENQCLVQRKLVKLQKISTDTNFNNY